ncbi:MAG: diacylglycerol kinase family protein [Chloroflexi bacterium]|nr:diacylglycerol kinase family protein [Chloroflexota bacterium]
MRRPSFWQSVGFAWRGIVHTVRTQRNPRIHVMALVLVLLAGLVCGLTPQEWALVLLVSGFVLSAELFNSALEELADRVEPDFDPHIMRAKDAAAGGVLVAAITAVGVGLMVFGPHILRMLGIGPD